MKWPSSYESGGEYDYMGIANALSEYVPTDVMMRALRQTAAQLEGLQDRLAMRGVPAQILDMPGIGYKFISDKLARWGLL
jgi:serine/threonine-protein kinase HipA